MWKFEREPTIVVIPTFEAMIKKSCNKITRKELLFYMTRLTGYRHIMSNTTRIGIIKWSNNGYCNQE